MQIYIYHAPTIYGDCIVFADTLTALDINQREVMHPLCWLHTQFII